MQRAFAVETGSAVCLASTIVKSALDAIIPEPVLAALGRRGAQPVLVAPLFLATCATAMLDASTSHLADLSYVAGKHADPLQSRTSEEIREHF